MTEVHPIEAESYRIMRSRIDLSALPPLTRAVTERIIHATADFDPDSGSKAARAAASGGIDYHNRTLAEVERYFDGLVLEEPGVVPMLEWRPGIRHPRPRSVYYWVGMDRKPLRWPP